MTRTSPLSVLSPDLSVDAHLIDALCQVLPHFLVDRDGLDPVTARAFAQPLAEQLVKRAHEANQLHLLPELPRGLDAGRAGQDEREAFQLAVESLAIIQAAQADADNCAAVEQATRQLWALLASHLTRPRPQA